MDGTYGQANRQWKYLTHALALLSSQGNNSSDTDTKQSDVSTTAVASTILEEDEFFEEMEDSIENIKKDENVNNLEDVNQTSAKEKKNRNVMKLPVVKLDLEFGKCDSVLAGIMHQPGKDKICTYQVFECVHVYVFVDLSVFFYSSSRFFFEFIRVTCILKLKDPSLQISEKNNLEVSCV